MKYSLLLILSMGLSSVLLAQQELLKVTVLDTEKKALAYVNVLLMNTDKQVVAFAISDETGTAQLEVNFSSKPLWLTGALMGYASDTLQIPANESLQEIILPMRVSAFELQEVRIEDYKPPFKIDGDTTTYAADKYTQGHERNVEALIKKMPGVKVSKDGRIEYKGKPVSRVLLENDAIFGSKYAIATKNMSADVVDEIQFIDHYLENQLLKGIENSDELVMNIKVKEERKKLVFGSAHLNGGLPSRYDGQANLFSLLEKHKAVFLGNVSKRANGGFSPYEYFKGNSAFDSYDYERPAPDWVSLTPFAPNELDGQDYNDNATQMGATNLVLNPNKNVKIRGYLTAFNDRSRIYQESFFKELFLEENFELLEKEEVDIGTRGIDLDVEAIIQTSAKSNLSLNSAVYRGRENSQMQQFIRNASDSLTALQILNGQNQTQRHRVNFVRKVSPNQALVLHGTFYQNQRPNNFQFVNPEKEALLQRLQHRTQDLDAQLSLLGQKEKFSYKHSLIFQNQSDFLSQQLFQNDLERNPTEQLQAKARHFAQQKIGGRTKLSWQSNKLNYTLSGEGGYLRMKLTEQALDFEMRPYYEVGAQLTMKFNQKLKGILSYQFGQQFPGMTDLNDLQIYQSNRSISQGLGTITSLPNHHLLGNLSYTNPSLLLESFLSVTYGKNEQTFGQSYRYEGLTYISQTALLEDSDRFSATWGLDKFLSKVSTNLGLSLSYNFQRGPMLNQQLEQERVQNQQASLQLSATTVTNGWVDINLQLEVSQGIFKRLDRQINTDQEAFSSNQRLRTTVQLFFRPHEKWSIDPSMRYFILPSQRIDGQAKHFGLGDLEIHYDWKEKCSLYLGIFNLLNSEAFVQEQVDIQSYSRQSLLLNRRAFELGLSIQL